MFDWTPYLGHRIIVEGRWIRLMEFIVMETSAQGKVKFKDSRGYIFWNENRDYKFVEDLGKCLS